MQNDYLRIEDMLSLVSQKLSIVKYGGLKKIIFLTISFGLGLDLEPLWTRSCLGPVVLVLDSTKADLTTALVSSHAQQL